MLTWPKRFVRRRGVEGRDQGGMAYIKVEKGEWKSPIVKFFNETEKAAQEAHYGDRAAEQDPDGG